jgi:hypothetical protein
MVFDIGGLNVVDEVVVVVRPQPQRLTEEQRMSVGTAI